MSLTEFRDADARPKLGFIGLYFTLAEYRGKGIGQWLFDQAIECLPRGTNFGLYTELSMGEKYATTWGFDVTPLLTNYYYLYPKDLAHLEVSAIDGKLPRPIKQLELLIQQRSRTKHWKSSNRHSALHSLSVHKSYEPLCNYQVLWPRFENS